MLTITDIYEYCRSLGFSCDDFIYGEYINGNPYIQFCARKNDIKVLFILMLSLEYLGTYFGNNKHYYIVEQAKKLKDRAVAYDYWNIEIINNQTDKYSRVPHIKNSDMSKELILNVIKEIEGNE